MMWLSFADGAVEVFHWSLILMYVSSIRQLLPTGRFFPFRKAASSFGYELQDPAVCV
jgi:hypothetical protein